LSTYLIPIEKLRSIYYDPNDAVSVVAFAKQLINETLRPHLSPEEIALSNTGKGDFGNLLEAGYFKVKNNNESRPDIPESGIEIKSGQVKVVRSTQDVLKERLKISMIDYMRGFEAQSLQESVLWPKLEKILLLLFRKDGSSLRIDEKCVFSDLLSWSQDDIKQMSEDWLHIRGMVMDGRANELSEGHTWYLGACTAGANAATLRDAPCGVRAKVRAFSLKTPYLNYKLGYTSNMRGPKVLLLPKTGQTLDEYILSNMSTFFGKPLDLVAASIGRAELSQSFAKNMRSKVARALLEEIAGRHTVDISTDFEQFRKAGVIEKAVALEKNGSLKECISFPAFKWKELNEEVNWEDSELYGLLTNKFFFTVYQKTSTTMPLLIGCFFWTMPLKDLELMRLLWLDTKEKIRIGRYDDFIKKSQHDVGHVRPHARDALDTNPTPQGGVQTKKSFWLNNDYIKEVITKELKL
jgi:DNA mismatch repair protein MutH